MLDFNAGDKVNNNLVILYEVMNRLVTQVCTPSTKSKGKLHIIDMAMGDPQGIRQDLVSQGYQVITMQEWVTNKAKYIN
jgi:hypothetical protein